jgi:TolB-like protein
MQEDPADYEQEVARLQRQIEEKPDASAPLRDLGAIYVRTDRPNQAFDPLKKAFARDRNDPKTLFYLGVASEKIGRTQSALQLYARFDEVPEDSKFRSLLEGRHQWLLREEIREEISAMIAREDTLAGGNVNARRVAVLPFHFAGGDQQYSPLGRGLSEMIAVDLASIDRLQLVERVRLEVLLNELQLAQSEYVNPASAPEVGRLLGAGRLIGGSYVVPDGGRLRVDVALAELTDRARSTDLQSRSGDLEDLFRLKRQIVFGLVDRLDVQLTAEERAEIERVPTRNIQAFLAYSRGLEAEARGDFNTAAQAYREAQLMDPGFSRAAEQQETAEGLRTASGDTGEAVNAARQVEPPPTQIDLVQNRQEIQSESIGVSPTADEEGDESDERDPVTENENTSPPTILKDPPPPPSSGGGQ